MIRNAMRENDKKLEEEVNVELSIPHEEDRSEDRSINDETERDSNDDSSLQGSEFVNATLNNVETFDDTEVNEAPNNEAT
jgi:hypothetical protein